jgi:hypothetical protein
MTTTNCQGTHHSMGQAWYVTLVTLITLFDGGINRFSEYVHQTIIDFNLANT